jgi:glycosyltransferase involved in cell wall biosynthesis
MNITKPLALIGDKDGCAMWRVFQPFAELQRRGYPAEWGDRDDNRLAAIVHKFNAVILPRLHWPLNERDKAEHWFNALHRAGLAVIYEVDDDLLSDDFRRRLTEIHGKTQAEADEVVSGVLHTLSMVDGVTVSNPYLKRMMQRRTDKPVVVVPNAIDLNWFTAVQKLADRRVPGLTIGWAGGVRPDTDVEQMAYAWQRVAQDYPHVNFVVFGHQANVIYDLVPHERIYALEWLPIEAYPMGLVNIDIGCCPLADTHFNRCKTFIKALEYAASGAAVVASPTVYGDLIELGRDGLIARTADEWYAALSSLIDSANVRNRMAQNLLHKTERDHSLTGNVLNWPVAWNIIREDFDRRRRQPQIIVPAWSNYRRQGAVA